MPSKKEGCGMGIGGTVLPMQNYGALSTPAAILATV
jgi:hypothetical protein